MGQIALQVPVVGLPNSTEDPKLVSDLAVIQTAFNGNVDDTNLLSPNNGVRRLLLQASGTLTGATAADLIFAPPTFLSSGQVAGVSVGVPIWVPDAGLSSQPADFQVANTTAYARVRGVVCANGTGPAVTFTLGLYQLTALGGAGGIAYTFGTALAGSTAALATPGANNALVAESGQFVLPTTSPTNPYMLGVNVGGTMTAGSFVSLTAQLYAYNA